MAAAIRIQNLYYLFCYAWDHFPDGKAIEAGLTDQPELLDLFAHILIRGVTRLLRRGLDRGYLEIEDDLETLRGRIIIADTIRRNLLQKQRAACRFDELQRDVLHNQIIKSTVFDLAQAEGLGSGFARQLKEIGRELSDISRITITSQIFRRVQLSRNSGQYGLLIRVCEFLHQIRLPTQDASRTKFGDVLSDETRMHDVFEKFVRNFYRHELKGALSVGGETILWDLTPSDPSHASFLPQMDTDVTVRFPERTVVIDTKYYRQTLSNYHGERVWSSHLYQLFSYLSNLEARSGIDENADGVLLYPVAGKDLSLRYSGRGHNISVQTVNLDRHWSDVREQLLSVAGAS